MRIAHISPLIENTGGHRILYEHISRLRRMGHQVDIYATGWHGTVSDEWKSLANGINYFLPIDKFPNSSNNLRLKDDYDIVIANLLGGAENCLHIDHPNKVYFYQNYDPFIFKDSPDQIKKAHNMYNAYDKHLLYCNALKKMILKDYPNKNIHVCTNGVTYKSFEPFQRKRNESIPRICFMAAYYGNLKGTKLAAQVFKKLQEHGFITVCIAAEEGPLPYTTKFYRNPSFEEKATIIANCDIMLHPSIFETWCMVTIESMALGVPVVATNSLGILEYANKDNMIIVKERDPDLIFNNIVSLLDDHNRYNKIMKSGIETAKEHDWDVIMPKIEQTYMEMCN